MDISNLRSTVFSLNYIQEAQADTHKEEGHLSQSSTDDESHGIPDIGDYSFYDYVSMYFQRDRSRFFHNATVDELASFSSKIPIHALLCVERAKIQDVLEMERWILSILGVLNDPITVDSSESGGHLDARDVSRLLNLLFQLASRKDVIDEIFCFLVKESIDTPDSSIELKIYEVMFVLLSCYHPSFNFFNYLASYLYKKINNCDEVGVYSGYHGQIAGLALNSLFSLLDDSFVNADVMELKSRLSHALSCLDEVESVSLPPSFTGCTMKELLLLEKTAGVFLAHNIPLETTGLYDQQLPSKGIWNSRNTHD